MPHAQHSKRQPAAPLWRYLALARLDHASKHVFIIPGIVLALLLRGQQGAALLPAMLLGLGAAICIASANYVINEWLDRDSDRHHPEKSHRVAVLYQLDARLVWLEWLLLVASGLLLAWRASGIMLAVAVVFALQGVVYNMQPLRTKDKAYLDVVSESVNSPLRFMLGWAMVDPGTLPPASILLAYWSTGCFLMAAKRLGEYREIVARCGKPLLVRYRASFASYSESSLLQSCFAYALSASVFLTVFLIKYRAEYLLLLPPVVMLFTRYLALALQPGSAAQHPEKLYRESSLLLPLLALALLFVLCTLVDMPLLENLSVQQFILLP